MSIAPRNSPLSMSAADLSEFSNLPEKPPKEWPGMHYRPKLNPTDETIYSLGLSIPVVKLEFEDLFCDQTYD